MAKIVRIALPLGILCAGLSNVPEAWPAEANQAHVLFILDASGSMQEGLEASTKLAVAKSVMSQLLPGLEKKRDFRLGLIVFAHRTRDCDDIELAVPIGEGTASEIGREVQATNALGMTPLAASLRQAGDLVRPLDGHRRIILLTDGKETCGGDPVKVAAALVAEGIDVRIHVIGFAVGADDVVQLEAIAKAGNGSFHKADTAAELLASFESITREIEREVLGAAERDDAVAGGVVFEDDFSREELGPDWKIVDEDPDRWTVDEGLLVITRRPEEVEEDGEKRQAYFNTLELQKALPDDFEATVEWEVGFQGGSFWGQEVFLEAVSDRGHLARAGFRHGTFALAYWYLGRFFQKVVGDKPEELLQVDRQERKAKTMDVIKVRARLTKKKNTFKAYSQITGEDWREIGEHKMLNFRNPALRLYQYNYPEAKGFEDPAPEVEAVVRKVTVKAIE